MSLWHIRPHRMDSLTERGLRGLVLVLCAAGWTVCLGGAAPAAQKGAAKTDLYGDPLPEGAVARLGTSRFRAGAQVRSVAFSPDGNTLVSVSGVWGQTDSLKFWDASSGRMVRSLKGHDRGTWMVAFAPDGNSFASFGLDQTIRVSVTATGNQIAQMRPVQAGGMGYVAFSPDGKTLASGHGQMVHLWELPSGKKLKDIGPGAASAFSSDGNRLAVVNIYRQAKPPATGKPAAPLQVYTVATGDKLLDLGTEKDYFTCVVFSTDGKTVAAGGMFTNRGQGGVAVFDSNTGKELHRATSGPGQVVSLALSPDGKTLAGISTDGALRLWEMDTGKETKSLRQADNRQTFYGGTSANTRLLAFSPKGDVLAAGGGDGVIRLYDARSGEELGNAKSTSGPVVSLAILPGGKTVLTAGQDRVVRQWDMLSGKQLREAGKTGLWGLLAVSGDGNTAAVDSEDGLRVWEPGSGKVLQSTDRKGQMPRGLRFSRDGAQVFSIGYDRVINGLNLRGGGDARKTVGSVETMAMVSAAFSGDCRLLATGEQAGLVVWDVSTGERVFDASVATQPKGLSFSPFDDVVAWGTGDVVGLIEVDSARQVLQISARKRWVQGMNMGDLALSPNGRTIAVGGEDGQIDLYDAINGKALAQFQGHGAGVHCLEFSPDGKFLVSGSADTTALVWDVARYSAPAGKTPAPAPTSGATAPADADKLERLWGDLAGEPGKAYQASWAILDLRQPQDAVAFFKDRLKPVPPPASDKVKALIADLDSPKYAVRTRAYDELSKLGALAEPALREVLRKTDSEETRTRVSRLLETMKAHVITTPDTLRLARAIRILERIGGTQARAIIQTVAQGAPSARPTRLAKVALERMAAAEKTK